VQLNVSFPEVTTYDTDPEDGTSPWVNLYHEPCADRPPEGTEPEIGDCFAAHIFVTAQDPGETSSLYYSGGLRLNGYFGVRSQSQEMHQGEVPLELEALSFSEASAAAS
jgi:hypothetical protein